MTVGITAPDQTTAPLGFSHDEALTIAVMPNANRVTINIPNESAPNFGCIQLHAVLRKIISFAKNLREVFCSKLPVN